MTGKRRIEIRIDAVKPFSKNTLIAFVDFSVMEVGLTIKGSTVHEKEGKRWIGMPAKEYTTSEGRKWAPMIEFDSKEARYALNDSVLAAFDEYQGRQPTRDSAPPEERPW